MQTRLDMHPLGLGIVGSALTIRVLSDDDHRVHRRLRRVAAFADRLPDRMFEVGALDPLHPITLHTVGRRSGAPHAVRLLGWCSGDRWAATTCMGREPDWMRNLRTAPEAQLEVEGLAVAVEAHFSTGGERDEVLNDLRKRTSLFVRPLVRLLMDRSSTGVLVVFRRC